MNTKLDERLKQWHAAHAPLEQNRKALRGRILRDVARPLDSDVRPASSPGFFRWAGMPRMAWGLAACGLLIFFLWVWRPPSAQETTPIAQAGETSWIKPPYALAALYQESRNLFGGALEWVAQSDHTIELGLESEPGEKAPAPRQPESDYAVTIALVTRQGGVARVVWKSDIIAGHETWVNVPPSLTQPIHFSTWFCRVGKDKLAVDAQWAAGKITSSSGKATQIVEEGKPAIIGSFICEGIKYEILQIARPVAQLTRRRPC